LGYQAFQNFFHRAKAVIRVTLRSLSELSLRSVLTYRDKLPSTCGWIQLLHALYRLAPQYPTFHYFMSFRPSWGTRPSKNFFTNPKFTLKYILQLSWLSLRSVLIYPDKLPSACEFYRASLIEYSLTVLAAMNLVTRLRRFAPII